MGFNKTWNNAYNRFKFTKVYATIARYIRSSTISQLKEDYVVVEYASGASKREVLYKVCIKNAILPVITILGMSFTKPDPGAFYLQKVFLDGQVWVSLA